MNPLISIIIPTCNKYQIVSNAINSAKEQSWKNIEIVVVDDGSTDQTPNTLDAISNIIVIRNNINKGVAEARMKGVLHAKGKFICFLDDDDCWETNHLETLFKSIDKSSSDVVFSNYKTKIKGISSEFKMDYFSKNFYEKILMRPGPFLQSCIFKSSIFREKKLFDNNAIPSEDWDFFITLAKNKIIFSYSNHCGFIWNFNSQSQSANLTKEAKAIEYIVKKNKDSILTVHGKNILSDHYRRIARIYEKNNNFNKAKKKYDEAYLISKYYYKNIFYKFILSFNIGYNFKVINFFRFFILTKHN